MEFLDADDLKRALNKDKEYMGSRFCHVTKTTAEERDYTLAKQTEGFVLDILLCSITGFYNPIF